MNIRAIINNIGLFAGVSGVTIASLFKDAWASHVVVGLVLVALIAALLRVFLAVKAWQNRHYPNGYVPVANFFHYSTLDGKTFTYEVFRHIQIKAPWLSSVDHKFYWSGTKLPVIKSSLQTPSEITHDPNTKESKLALKFATTKYYNETETLHFQMTLDDSDQQSKPFLMMKAKEPMQLVEFHVGLHHANGKQNAKKAKMQRRKESSNQLAPYEDLAEIAFDPNTKSYKYLLVNPEPGYEYRISWEKPAVQGVPKAK